MSDLREHPTAGRRRRRKSPASGYMISNLALPTLPDHLRADEDCRTGSDEAKRAKRMRSASTTPRSVRGADPDDYDRVMGVTSVGFLETAMFGEGNAPGIAVDQDGVANNSKNVSEYREESNTCHESDSGAGRASMGKW